MFLVVLTIMIVIPVIVVSLFVVALLSFHIYLLVAVAHQIVGKTTKETIKTKSKTLHEEGLSIEPPKSPGLRQNLFSEVDKLQEKIEQRRPFLNFSMILTKSEAEYLSNFDVCLNGQQP